MLSATNIRRCLLALITSTATLFFSSLASAELPTVQFKTDVGEFTIELYPDKAPLTVANFLQYCQDNFYTGTIFHRVVPGFVVQGGGLTFDYTKKPVRDPVNNESGNGLKNIRGSVAMARLANPDSATSQFFINLRNNRHLNPKKDTAGYTVFGRVTEGMNVVEKMTQEPIGKYRPEAPNLPIRILAVKIHSIATEGAPQ